MEIDILDRPRGRGDRLQRRKRRERRLRRGARIARLERRAEQQRDVAMVAEEQAGPRDQLRQQTTRIAIPPLPQFRAVIAVERYRDVARRRRLHRRDGALCRYRTQRRGDPRQMQAIDAVEQLIPVPRRCRRLSKGGMRPVVDYLGRAHPGAGGDEIQPHARAAQRDAARIDAMATQRRDRRSAEVVVRHLAGKAHVMAQPRERRRDIRLRPRDPHVQLRRLQQELAPRRRQAQHDLAECQQRPHEPLPIRFPACHVAMRSNR